MFYVVKYFLSFIFHWLYSSSVSGARLQCAIVEEESEEEEDKKWSCLDSSQTELSLERSLDKVLPPGSGVKLETPAPFPLTSQIGTGLLVTFLYCIV